MRMVLACLLLAVTQGFVLAQPADPEWPSYRHDTWLSGRSPLKGSITTPAVINAYDLRAWDNLVAARFAAGRTSSVALQRQKLEPDYLATNADQWGVGPPRYDLAGDGKLTSLPDDRFTRYARLLPGSKGVQKIHNDDYFGTGVKDQRKVYAYAFEPASNEPKLLWESGPWEELEGTALAIVDADGDGLPEVVGNTWGRLFVWNGQTGEKKMYIRWHPPKRDYGYFAAVKLTPSDPAPSFVVIGDFVTHIDVIGNTGKELKVLWAKDVEAILSGKYKACRPLVNSAQDVDGDGCIDVIANLFNDTGDNRWHLMVYEGTTGKVKLDVPDVYAYAAEDVTGDGRPEFFCVKASGRMLPNPASLLVGSVAGGKLAWTFKVPGSGMWEFAEIRQLPLNVDNTMAADSRRTIRLADMDGDGRPEFFVHTPSRLTVYGCDAGGKFVEKGQFRGPRLAVAGVRQSDPGKPAEILLSATPAPEDVATVTASGQTLQLVSCRPRTPPVTPPIVFHASPKETGSIVTADSLDRIICLDSRLRPRWAFPGRGITPDASNRYGVIAADLKGDGNREVVFGRPGVDGTAEIVAVDADGKTLWVHPFTGFSGPEPTWNQNGLTHWSVGRYMGRKGMDIAVSLRRSSMHTDETHLLDGRTGAEVWCNPFTMTHGEQDKRGFGGALTASYDYDGDGCEDIVCEYPDEYYAASGKTGQLLFGKWVGDIFPGGWLGYGVPIIGPFLEDGKTGVMWTQGGYRRGMMTLQGDRLWTFDYMDGYGGMPAIGDFNGDGKLEGISNQKGKTTCYDMATGAIRWTSGDFIGTDGVCCDINGDGRDEAIFGSGNNLLALNEIDGKPNLVWSLPLKANLGPAAIADVDEDGKAEIVVMTRDGMLNVIGGR